MWSIKYIQKIYLIIGIERELRYDKDMINIYSVNVNRSPHRLENNNKYKEDLKRNIASNLNCDIGNVMQFANIYLHIGK